MVLWLEHMLSGSAVSSRMLESDCVCVCVCVAWCIQVSLLWHFGCLPTLTEVYPNPTLLYPYLPICLPITSCDSPSPRRATSREAMTDSGLRCDVMPCDRNWMALYTKLGGDNEASRMMGRATQSVASHFAAPSQIDAVSCHPNAQPGIRSVVLSWHICVAIISFVKGSSSLLSLHVFGSLLPK